MNPKKPTKAPTPGSTWRETSSAPFPTHTLPDPILSMVRWVADVHGVPEVVPAAIALSMVSAAMGKGLKIKSGGVRLTMGNLFFLVSCFSGVGKSVVQSIMLEPLKIIQDCLRLLQEIQEEDPPKGKNPVESDGSFEGFVGLLSPPPGRSVKSNSRRRGRSSADKVPQPTIICSDATGPAMEQLLGWNHETILSASPEAGDFLREASRATGHLGKVLLGGYSGDRVEIHRLRREEIVLHQPCITVCWLCQPLRLEEFLASNRLLEDGLLARFCVAHSNASMAFLPEEDRSIPIAVINSYSAMIMALFDTYHQRPDDSLSVATTPEALHILKSYYNRCAARWHADQGQLRSCIARWAEQAWRLTLVLHAATHGGNSHNMPVDRQTAEDAIVVQEWFAEQQMRILGGATQPPENNRLQRLLDLLREVPDRELTLRDLKNSHGFDHDEVQSLVKLAPSLLSLQNRQNPRGGPRSLVLKLIDSPP